jgi:23S rRNA (pseudouridine1915-N3)-methyltransferase
MAGYPIQIQIIAVGKLKQSFWQAATQEYLERLQRYAAVEIGEVRDVLGRGKSEKEALEEEAAEISKRLQPQALQVALDKDGKQFSSEQFAVLLKKEIDNGRRLCQFVIGGPAGLAPGLMKLASLRLSLSAMTFPHEMARAVLLEQLYRAFTILRGEKYHK